MSKRTHQIGADSNGHCQLDMIFFKLVKASVRESSNGTSAELTEVRVGKHNELGDFFALQGPPG
jgi:hypothetical protein